MSVFNQTVLVHMVVGELTHVAATGFKPVGGKMSMMALLVSTSPQYNSGNGWPPSRLLTLHMASQHLQSSQSFFPRCLHPKKQKERPPGLLQLWLRSNTESFILQTTGEKKMQVLLDSRGGKHIVFWWEEQHLRAGILELLIFPDILPYLLSFQTFYFISPFCLISFPPC